MIIEVDSHTHTVASGHAYSTVLELAKIAKEKKLKAFGIADHGPSMQGASSIIHFLNLHIIPEMIDGVRVFKGAEANIIDYEGTVDISELALKRIDYAIASFHDICIEPSTVEDHTKALLGVIKNPLIDILGHLGNPTFAFDKEKVVLACKEYGKLIEINNHSHIGRQGSEVNCYEIARLCKKHQVKMVCGSDAHICFDVGKFDWVSKLFDEIQIPKECVLASSLDEFEQYIKNRKIKHCKRG